MFQIKLMFIFLNLKLLSGTSITSFLHINVYIADHFICHIYIFIPYLPILHLFNYEIHHSISGYVLLNEFFGLEYISCFFIIYDRKQQKIRKILSNIFIVIGRIIQIQ